MKPEVESFVWSQAKPFDRKLILGAAVLLALWLGTWVTHSPSGTRVFAGGALTLDLLYLAWRQALYPSSGSTVWNAVRAALVALPVTAVAGPPAVILWQRGRNLSPFQTGGVVPSWVGVVGAIYGLAFLVAVWELTTRPTGEARLGDEPVLGEPAPVEADPALASRLGAWSEEQLREALGRYREEYSRAQVLALEEELARRGPETE